MFKSFFPRPKLFLLSGLIWCAVIMTVWYAGAHAWGQYLGLGIPTSEDGKIVGVHYFWSPSFLWLYVYYIAATVAFAAFWFVFSPHRWQLWSIVGSSLILFITYYGVQVDVAINNWRGPFFDAIQAALSGDREVPQSELWGYLLIFLQIASIAVFVFVGLRFFVQHWIFRWRTAMNEYYMARWGKLRHIEGASQRVQEDTMRFASVMEGLGVSVVEAVMTLVAFLPVLWALSSYVQGLPLVGDIPAPLVTAALVWSIFGTVLMAVAGIRLPGLEFRNQRVEAAYRKELVYGEDDEKRAEPMTVRDLFSNVRKNYFTLYFNYMYFNVFRSSYLQLDNIYVYALLIPTIVVASSIGFTLGIFQQILAAFNRVSNSFQYLINVWPTIVELLSIYKRLKSFESALTGGDLPDIDREWLEMHGAKPTQVEQIGPGI